jgi:putative SOS response-associated peptidase YedK
MYTRRFRAVHGSIDIPPRYNVAPGCEVFVCRESAPARRELAMPHRGLMPSRARDPEVGYRTINGCGNRCRETGLSQRIAPERVERYPVGFDVNSPKNDAPALMRRC